MTSPQAGAVAYCTACGAQLDHDGACPVHGRVQAAPARRRRKIVLAAAVVAAVLLVGAASALLADERSRSTRLRLQLAELDRQLVAQAAAANGLSRRLADVEAKLNSRPDQAEVARRVSASVFTVETEDAVGSAFVISSSGGRTSLVTNYHVIEDDWEAGRRQVRLRQPDRDLEATIEQVNRANDLALVTTAATVPALERAATEPAVGDQVLVVGAPLGLGGTVSNGIVSAFREGYIQFSAPIGPGNSGGPVVNQQGEVIGVARSKLVALGAEGLSFAIPIAIVCSTMKAC